MPTIPNRPNRVLQIAAALVPLATLAASAHADIFQWEYINPANPSQGKQQSTTLAPDGAGVGAVPGTNLEFRNLTMAYLIGANLSPYVVYDAEGYPSVYVISRLTGANLSQADLTNANLSEAALTGADFTNAEARGATFQRFNSYFGIGIGITLAQLYSTASYQARDLTGIGLSYSPFAGGNFAGQNLTNASFGAATLTGANFHQANLTNVHFGGATLTDADF